MTNHPNRSRRYDYRMLVSPENAPNVGDVVLFTDTLMVIVGLGSTFFRENRGTIVLHTRASVDAKYRASDMLTEGEALYAYCREPTAAEDLEWRNANPGLRAPLDRWDALCEIDRNRLNRGHWSPADEAKKAALFARLPRSEDE